MLKLSNRSDIPVFRVMDTLRIVNERVAAGEDIIHLEYGQPSTGAPEDAIAYGIETLQNGKMGYTETAGLPALRERICQYYQAKYALKIDPAQIVMTMGGSGGLLLSFMACFDVGDRVVMAAPGYPAYRNMMLALGIEVHEMPTSAEDNYQPTVAALDALPFVPDGLIIGNPSNPTGTILEAAAMAELTAWCKKKGVRLIADELYQGITFGGAKPASALYTTDEAVIVQSFSKYFAMTGWRLGFTIAPKDVTSRIKRLAESLFIAPPTLSQHVALKVFDHTDELDGYVARYEQNYRLLKTELTNMGFTKLSNVQGAFYIYADVSDLTTDSESFCRQILDDAKVAVTPGIDFDSARGHQTLRLSFAGSTGDITEACHRLAHFMNRWNALAKIA